MTDLLRPFAHVRLVSGVSWNTHNLWGGHFHVYAKPLPFEHGFDCERNAQEHFDNVPYLDFVIWATKCQDRQSFLLSLRLHNGDSSNLWGSSCICPAFDLLKGMSPHLWDIQLLAWSAPYLSCWWRRVNEFFQTSMLWCWPWPELWLVIVAKSRPNVSPKRFQVCSHIEILGVVGRTEDHGSPCPSQEPKRHDLSKALCWLQHAWGQSGKVCCCVLRDVSHPYGAGGISHGQLLEALS